MNNIKFANAVYNYKNTKEKLCNTSVAMWFLKMRTEI